MDHLKTYNALIHKRINNALHKSNQYCEAHHIIPKEEGGSDKSTNLVNLTAREHYVAHRLLKVIYNDDKMNHSFNCMRGHGNSREFEKIRIKMGQRNVGYKNPQYGKRWWTNGLEQKLSYECPGQNWFLGLCKETIDKHSLSSKGEKNGMFGKRGQNNPNFGKKFWNNGLIEKKSKTCPGNGFIKGRLKRDN